MEKVVDFDKIFAEAQQAEVSQESAPQEAMPTFGVYVKDGTTKNCIRYKIKTSSDNGFTGVVYFPKKAEVPDSITLYKTHEGGWHFE